MEVISDDYINKMLDEGFSPISESDLDKVQGEIDVALEAISALSEKANKVRQLQIAVQEEGVSRVSMEALQSIMGDNVLPSCATLEMFTINPSTISIEYANEGFKEAFDKIDKEAVMFIVKVIVGIISAVLGVFKIVQVRQDMNETKRKEAEVKSSADYQKLREEYNQKVRDTADKMTPEQMGVKLKAKDYLDRCHSKFGTRLYEKILKRIPGYTLLDSMKNLECWVAYMQDGFDDMEKVIELTREFYTRGLQGQACTDQIMRIEEIVLRRSRVRIANYTLDIAGIRTTNMGAVSLDEEGEDILFSHGEGVLERYDDGKFWRVKYFTPEGTEVRPYQYKESFSAGKNEPAGDDFRIAFDDWPHIEITDIRRHQRDLKKNAEALVKDAKAAKEEINEWFKKNRQDITKRNRAWNADPNFESYRVVWPKYHPESGIRVGDVIDFQTKLDTRVLTATDFPDNMFGTRGELALQFTNGLVALNRVVRDISQLVVANFDIYDVYFIHSIYMRDDIIAMDKARKKFLKDNLED